MWRAVLFSLGIHVVLLTAICLPFREDIVTRPMPRANHFDLRVIASSGALTPLPTGSRTVDAVREATRPGMIVAVPAAPAAAVGPSPVRSSAVVGPVAEPTVALPSGGGGASVLDPAAGNAYRDLLLRHIAAYRQPVRAGGTVIIRLSLVRDGSVGAASVSGSSGNSDLDDEAIATIWRARPMPPIPATLPDRLTIVLPVAFTAGQGRAP